MYPFDEVKDFFDYLGIDEDTCETFIRDDAPESAKRAYEEFKRKEAENVDEHGRIEKV